MVNFVPVICTQCGAQLQVPDDLEQAFCNHCGTKFVIQTNKVDVHHQGTVHHTGNIGGGSPTCPRCGNVLSAYVTLRACDECGKRFCNQCDLPKEVRSTQEDHSLAKDKALDAGIFHLMRSEDICPDCKLLTYKNTKISCHLCRGSGKCDECIGYGETGMFKKQTCTRCNGDGKCYVCDGTGKVPL